MCKHKQTNYVYNTHTKSHKKRAKNTKGCVSRDRKHAARTKRKKANYTQNKKAQHKIAQKATNKKCAKAAQHFWRKKRKSTHEKAQNEDKTHQTNEKAHTHVARKR